MMEVGILTLDNLECHFNWKPEIESTKERNVKTVTEKIKNKIEQYPQFTVAYRCSLAYLYTLPDFHDFNEAYDYLDGTKAGLPTRDDLKIQERWLGCDFIERATRLKMKEREFYENGCSLGDASEELARLTDLWANNRVKATVYAVKGVTFNCFGPMKYHVAVEAFKNAIKLAESDSDVCSNWQMFDWLWGCAFSMSRVTRQTPGLPPGSEEIEYWKRAFSWKDCQRLSIDEPLFYAHYAETIMLLKDKINVCEQMIELAFSLWQNLTFESKLLDSLVLIIALKFCQIYPRSDKMKSHFKDIDIFEYLGHNNEIYRQVAKLMNFEEENFVGIKILETGLEKNGDSANIWFDLQLQSRYSKSVKPDDWIRRNYSSILQKYKPYPKNVATILIHRSKWLFYKEIFPNRFENIRTTNVSVLDECFADIISAKSKDCQISVVGNYVSKLNAVLQMRRNERPEYLAWFQYNFFQNSSINEIIELYRAALRDNTCSGERKVFVIKNLSIVYLHDRRFSEAISILRDVTQSNKDCRVIFAKAVIENPSRSLKELLECLELGNFDVITLILDILEAKKNQTNLREVLLGTNFFDEPRKPLFFSKINYEICAKIQLLLKNDIFFFIGENQAKSEELIKNISEKLHICLGIPMERPTLVTYAWRRARLELVKSFIRLKDISNKQNDQEMEKVLHINTLEVLRESRSALDPCFKRYFNIADEDKSHYPHAFLRMTKKEKEWLLKTTGSRRNYDQQRPGYLLNRMENWLRPAHVLWSDINYNSGSNSVSSSAVDGSSKVSFNYKVVEGLLREGFPEKCAIPTEILDFLARREYHIIKKEAAWHAIWVETDNFFKHGDHTRDIEELERKLNEYREITKLFQGEKITAYDVAHQAAEFAEQTFAVFVGK